MFVKRSVLCLPVLLSICSRLQEGTQARDAFARGKPIIKVISQLKNNNFFREMTVRIKLFGAQIEIQPTQE